MVERPTGVTIVAALYLVQGALALLAGLAIILLGGAFAAMIPGMAVSTTNGDVAANAAAAGGFFGAIFGIIGIISLVIGILAIVIGWFLLKGKNWARWIAIVFAILSLFGFPIGTIIGAAEIYFLLIDKNAKAYFENPSA